MENSYFIEGNSKSLEQILNKSGLSEKEVEVLKKEKNEGADKYYKKYRKTDIKNKRLVPVNRIIGIGSSRGSIGESWFENLLNYSKHHNFRTSSINDLLSNMVDSIHNFRHSFQQEEFSNENLQYVHFVEDDIYVSTSGGSHRTLFSKISGAEFILAEIVEYHFDEQKDRNYKKIQKEHDSFNELVRGMNLNIYSSENRGELEYTIGFKDIGIIKKSNISIFDYSDESSINFALETIQNEKEYLNSIMQEYVKLALIPYKLRKLIVKIKLNFNNEWKLKHLKKLIDLGWSI